MAPWREVTVRRGSAGALLISAFFVPGFSSLFFSAVGVAPGWPTLISCRLPVDPSMMVTVLGFPAAGLSPSASAVGAVASGLAVEGVVRSAALFGCALTTATGSPPNGSSTNRIQPTSTATQSESNASSDRVTTGIGSTNDFFFFGCWPSGLCKSSVGSSADKRGLHGSGPPQPKRQALTDRLP